MVEFNKSSKFYDVTNESCVEGTNLIVMKGYFTSIHLINGNLNVLIDVSTRVLRAENFLETLLAKGNDRQDYIGMSVIANYGNYTIYKIEEIDTKMTIFSEFSWKG
jgi:hypothetical protein